MAAPRFQYFHADMPCFDTQTVLDHVARVNVRLALKLENELDDDERDQFDTVIEWIWTQDRLLYQTLQEIIEQWQNAYHASHIQSQALLRSYYEVSQSRARYAMMLEAYSADLEEKPEEKKKKEKILKRKIEKHEAREEQNGRIPITKKMRQDVEDELTFFDHKAFFWRVEPWSDDVDVKDYVHFVGKGKDRLKLEELKDFDIWKYVYHCNGPWDAERLTELLTDAGIMAYTIKRRRGPADKEVLHYKVVSTRLLKE